MLGIEYPIFAFNHCRDVTAAVSNAGGIGVLGVSGMSSDEKRVRVEWLRKNTDKSFGLDLLLPQANPEMGTHKELMSKIPRENIEYMDKLREELGFSDGYIAPLPIGGLGLYSFSQSRKRGRVGHLGHPIDGGGLIGREGPRSCYH